MHERQFEIIGGSPSSAAVAAYGQLTSELELESHGGPNVEKPTAAMFRALLDAGPEIQTLLLRTSDYVFNHRRLYPGPVASLYRTSFVHLFATIYASKGLSFDDAKRIKAADWEEPLGFVVEELAKDNSEPIEIFYANMIARNASTPSRERSYSDELIAQLVSDRFGKGVRGLDYGCSLGIGAIQLLYKDQFPMEFQNVGAPTRGKQEDLTDRANVILARPKVFQQITGVDRGIFYSSELRRYDKTYREFALNGLRPSERNDPEYMNVINQLLRKVDKKKPEYNEEIDYDEQSGFEFFWGDFLKDEGLATFVQTHPDPFDVIMVNFVTQELSVEERYRMHGILVNLLSENGILIYNHQARIMPRRIARPAIENIVHYQTYATYPYRSKMHIFDNLNPRAGIQELMSYFDNRLRKLRLGMGRLVVNDEAVPIIDLVKNA